MPIPIIAALVGVALGRKTAPKKKAVSKYTKKNGTKVKAYTKTA